MEIAHLPNLAQLTTHSVVYPTFNAELPADAPPVEVAHDGRKVLQRPSDTAVLSEFQTIDQEPGHERQPETEPAVKAVQLSEIAAELALDWRAQATPERLLQQVVPLVEPLPSPQADIQEDDSHQTSARDPFRPSQHCSPEQKGSQSLEILRDHGQLAKMLHPPLQQKLEET